MNSNVLAFSEPRLASSSVKLRAVSEVDNHGHATAIAEVFAAESYRSLEEGYAETQGSRNNLLNENIVLREEIERTSVFEEIVGVSLPIRSVLLELSRVAPTDATVLIT